MAGPAAGPFRGPLPAPQESSPDSCIQSHDAATVTQLAASAIVTPAADPTFTSFAPIAGINHIQQSHPGGHSLISRSGNSETVITGSFLDLVMRTENPLEIWSPCRPCRKREFEDWRAGHFHPDSPSPHPWCGIPVLSGGPPSGPPGPWQQRRGRGLVLAATLLRCGDGRERVTRDEGACEIFCRSGQLRRAVRGRAPTVSLSRWP